MPLLHVLTDADGLGFPESSWSRDTGNRKGCAGSDTVRWAHRRATVLPASYCLMAAFPPQDPQHSGRDIWEILFHSMDPTYPRFQRSRGPAGGEPRRAPVVLACIPRRAQPTPATMPLASPSSDDGTQGARRSLLLRLSHRWRFCFSSFLFTPSPDRSMKRRAGAGTRDSDPIPAA